MPLSSQPRGNHNPEMCASDTFVPYNFTTCICCVIAICPSRSILQSSPSFPVPPEAALYGLYQEDPLIPGFLMGLAKVKC